MAQQDETVGSGEAGLEAGRGHSRQRGRPHPRNKIDLGLPRRLIRTARGVDYALQP